MAGTPTVKLIESNLFLVMDPWHVHPDGGYGYHDQTIDEHNNDVAIKIADYAKDIVHRAVSIPAIYTVNPLLSDWIVLNNSWYVNEYMRAHHLTSIVYAGFHHGQCLLDRPAGIRQMSKYYKCYLKRDLVCILPGDDEEAMDKRSLPFVEFI